jgi:hypothetical protein
MVERSIGNREVPVLKYEEEEEAIDAASTAVGLALGVAAIAAVATGVAAAHWDAEFQERHG